VNANQVFGWRRLYLAGRLGEQKARDQVASGSGGRDLADSWRGERGCTDFDSSQASTIHIELRQAQVRIEGRADPALVRVLLECLRA